jgi:photosystem II stability/assembly factor-like uncharacterized protein
VLTAQYYLYYPNDFTIIGDTWWMTRYYDIPERVSNVERSNDYGKTWDVMYSDPNYEVELIDFIDKDNGWVKTREGYTIKTTDGGKTWLPSGYSTHLWSDTMRFIDYKTGFILGEVFLKTTDGGDNWQTHVFTADSNTYMGQEYSFLSDSIIFVHGLDIEHNWDGDRRYDVLFKTTDQGDNWEVIRERQIGNANPIFFFSADSGYMLYGWSTKFTKDKGITWKTIGSLPYYYYEGNGGGDSQFFNSETAYFTSLIWPYPDTLYRTTDGCRTWSAVPGVGRGRIFFDGNTIVTVERNKQISLYRIRFCYSLDRGKTWQVNYFDPVVNVSDINVIIEYQLYQNYPNPFNPATTIKYSLLHSGRVILSIYDLLGREVIKLIDEEKPAGEYETKWNASSYPSGVYFLKMQAGQFTQTRKLILVK